jgi:Holliday junction resolvase RusA-like endonuclease
MFLFELHGNPIPQKQSQVFSCNGKPRFYDPSSKVKAQMQWQMKPYAPKEPLQCPVNVDIVFYMPIPKATSGIRKRQMINQVILPTKRPDIDNMAYLITNAMKEIYYADDSQIVDLHLHKRYSDQPKTVVKIIPIEHLAQTRGDDINEAS